MKPKLLIWLVTGKCNLNCKYCYARRFLTQEELTTREAKRIVKEAHEIGVEHIAFTGGEPLLREDIFELLEFANTCGVEASITTNGTLITEDVAKTLKKLNTFLYISIDGVGKTHETLREKGTWDKLSRVFEILKKYKIPFATITTLSKSNYLVVEETIKFLKEIGAEFSCMLPLMPFGRAKEDYVLSKDELKDALFMVSESAHRYKHTVNLWCMPFAIKYIENSYIYVAGCRNVDTIDIAPNGDMLLCDVLDIVITDVRKRSLSEALKIFENHPLVKKLSQPVKKEPCKNCYVREFCMGGCYARAFKVYGNFNEKDPMCG